MAQTKDYFIKRVETQKKEDRKTRNSIIINAILGVSSLAASAYVLGTEGYAFDSIIIERLCPILGVVGAALSYNEIMNAIKSKTSATRENKTPSEKAKTYTKNLQREITFNTPKY